MVSTTVLLVLAGACSVVSVLFAKYYTLSKSRRVRLLLLAFGLLSVCLLFWLYIELFQRSNVTSDYLFTDILPLVIIAILSWLLFHEKLSFVQVLGLLLIGLGIWLAR